MSLSLANFEANASEAIKHFWQTRIDAVSKQRKTGKLDQGERAGVTGGKNMNGFVQLVCDVITSNGLPADSIQLQKRVLTLPGFFRPTKSWDLLVIHDGRLIVAVEFKSQVGPSFGNNFNNRAEEAIGTGLDLHTAYREGAFGDQPKPFVGWMMLLEDCEKSRRPVTDRSPHFPAFEEFSGACYAERYHQLCKKMMQEDLYDAAAFMLTQRVNVSDGDYSELDRMTGLKTFVTQLAGRVAVIIIRLMVGLVFLSEGVQKFLFPDDQGVGRFIQIGLPEAEFLAYFVAVFEIVCGILIVLGLLTRLAVVPTITIMLVAIFATKIPIYASESFWQMAHDARTDGSMLLGSLFLLIVGAGRWSVDEGLSRGILQW